MEVEADVDHAPPMLADHERARKNKKNKPPVGERSVSKGIRKTSEPKKVSVLDRVKKNPGDVSLNEGVRFTRLF